MRKLKRASLARALCIGAALALTLPHTASAKHDALRRPITMAAGAQAGQQFMKTCSAVNTLAEAWQSGSIDAVEAKKLAEGHRRSAELTFALIGMKKDGADLARMLAAGKALVDQAKALGALIDQNTGQARQQYREFAARTDEAILSLTGRRIQSFDLHRASRFDFDIVSGTRSSGQIAPTGQFTLFRRGPDNFLGALWKFDNCIMETGIVLPLTGADHFPMSFGRENSPLFAFIESEEGLTGGYVNDFAGGFINRLTYARTDEKDVYLHVSGEKLVVTRQDDGLVELSWRRRDGSAGSSASGMAGGNVIAAIYAGKGDHQGVALYRLRSDGHGTGRWLTNKGASGTEVLAPPKDATTPPAWKAPDYTPDVFRFAEVLRKDLGNAARFRPTDTEIEAITATAADAELLRAYVDQVYSQLQAGVSAAKPGQTEIMTAGPALKDLPGGYSQHVEHFRKGIEIYGFKYVEPGKTSGMAYDGLFRLGVRWFFIPKAWRAFAP